MTGGYGTSNSAAGTTGAGRRGERGPGRRREHAAANTTASGHAGQTAGAGAGSEFERPMKRAARAKSSLSGAPHVSPASGNGVATTSSPTISDHASGSSASGPNGVSASPVSVLQGAMSFSPFYSHLYGSNSNGATIAGITVPKSAFKDSGFFPSYTLRSSSVSLSRSVDEALALLSSAAADSALETGVDTETALNSAMQRAAAALVKSRCEDTRAVRLSKRHAAVCAELCKKRIAEAKADAEERISSLWDRIDAACEVRCAAVAAAEGDAWSIRENAAEKERESMVKSSEQMKKNAGEDVGSSVDTQRRWLDESKQRSSNKGAKKGGARQNICGVGNIHDESVFFSYGVRLSTVTSAYKKAVKEQGREKDAFPGEQERELEVLDIRKAAEM